MADFAKVVTAALQKSMDWQAKRACRQSYLPIEDTVFDYAPPKKDGCYTVGFGKESILPPDIDTKTYYIAGYSENNPAKGVLDPPYVHALWLDDNAGKGGVLLLSLDIVGILFNDVNELKKLLNGFCMQTNCRAVHVFSTHNHAGIDTMGIWGRLPFSGKSEAYMRLIYESALSASYKAYDTKQTGKLLLSKIKVPDMQSDVRTPCVFSDILTKIRFVPENGGQEIWFLNFASHSESLQGCNHLVSADFPAYMRERILKKANAEVFYCVGAIGGMITMRLENEPLLRKEHRLAQSTRQIGEKLADYALQKASETPLSAGISLCTRQFLCPIQNPVLAVAGKIGLLNATPLPYPDDATKCALKTQLTYMEIGEQAFLLLPCELFPELAYGGYLSEEDSARGLPPEANPTPLLDIIKDPNAVIIGLADDELGYVLPPNDFILNPAAPYREKAVDKFNRRHYEETNSMGPETAEVIANQVKTVFETVCTVKNKHNKQEENQ